MGSIGRSWMLGALAVVALGTDGCGGVDEKNFSPTPGSAPPDAAKTPQEVDAKIPHLAPKTDAKQKRDI